jgi:hypothetical protein
MTQRTTYQKDPILILVRHQYRYLLQRLGMTVSQIFTSLQRRDFTLFTITLFIHLNLISMAKKTWSIGVCGMFELLVKTSWSLMTSRITSKTYLGRNTDPIPWSSGTHRPNAYFRPSRHGHEVEYSVYSEWPQASQGCGIKDTGCSPKLAETHVKQLLRRKGEKASGEPLLWAPLMCEAQLDVVGEIRSMRSMINWNTFSWDITPCTHRKLHTSNGSRGGVERTGCVRNKSITIFYENGLWWTAFNSPPVHQENLLSAISLQGIYEIQAGEREGQVTEKSLECSSFLSE